MATPPPPTCLHRYRKEDVGELVLSLLPTARKLKGTNYTKIQKQNLGFNFAFFCEHDYSSSSALRFMLAAEKKENFPKRPDSNNQRDLRSQRRK